MNLTNNEKRLLKIMIGVIIFSGIVLYYVYQPPEINTIPSRDRGSSEQGSSENTGSTTAPRRSGGGGSRGGGSSSGGSSSEGGLSISVSNFESHNSLKSCWVFIEGTVYDITGYLQNIENPESLEIYCGTFGFKEGYLGDSEEAKNDVIRQSISMGNIG